MSAPLDVAPRAADPGLASMDRTNLPDFRQVFEVSPRPMLLIAADDRFTMEAVNAAHARAFGSTPDALQGWGVLEVFPKNPDAVVAAFVEAIRTSLTRVVATGAPDQMPIRAHRVLGDDGQTHERFWSATNTPLFDAEGRVSHILSAIQDVTGEVAERRGEKARQLLMREVDHRARNALTIVQSFVRLTRAATLDSFREILDGRVETLARAQTSLAARRWEGGGLEDLVRAELAAISATGRFTVAGPAVELGPDHVQAMSMAIHELATNAGKYGALSTEEGRLTITWTRRGDHLDLSWSETGGPPTRAPDREGFGSRLIGQLARQLGGRATFAWAPEGLQVLLSVSLRAPADAA